MQTILKQATSDTVFNRPTSVLYDCVSEAFCMSAQVCTAKYHTPDYMPFGLEQWFAHLELSLVIVGVRAQKLPGQAFAKHLAANSETKP